MSLEYKPDPGQIEVVQKIIGKLVLGESVVYKDTLSLGKELNETEGMEIDNLLDNSERIDGKKEQV